MYFLHFKIVSAPKDNEGHISIQVLFEYNVYLPVTACILWTGISDGDGKVAA